MNEAVQYFARTMREIWWREDEHGNDAEKCRCQQASSQTQPSTRGHQQVSTPAVLLRLSDDGTDAAGGGGARAVKAAGQVRSAFDRLASGPGGGGGSAAAAARARAHARALAV